MRGQQTLTKSLFYYFLLEDQIPESHLLRLIDRQVDLSFVRDLGRPILEMRSCEILTDNGY
jgi:transposase